MIKILDQRFNHMMKVSQIPSKVKSQDILEMSINNLFCYVNNMYFEPSQTSTIEFFCEIVNAF